MFGYVRPNKAELKVREFVRYQAVYCGICKTIGRRYGQLPRTAANYDMTFLALFLMAMAGEDPGMEMQNCILHPARKNMMALESEALDFTAAAAVLLARGKFQDNLEDKEKRAASASLKLLFSRAAAKASADYPAAAELIRKQLRKQREAEERASLSFSWDEMLRPFAGLLGGLMELAPLTPEPEEQIRRALVYIGEHLGAWIYLIDAVDDREKDKKKGHFNPLFCGEKGEENERLREAEKLLKEAEDKIDAAASLLPFYRDASILSNIIQEGLPSVREAVFQGQKLLPL